MQNGPDIARIATLIGDPARANILTALMSGKALTSRELAAEAGVGASTASAHLAKLADGGLVTVAAQGRHRYHRLAGSDVADVLEALMGLAHGRGHLRHQTGPKDAALRDARVCYNHLAGAAGTALFEGLRTKGWITADTKDVALTDTGHQGFRDFGLDMAALSARRTALCRPCLDWSERRMHLAGSAGRALLARFETLGWARRVAGSRVIQITPPGRNGLRETFGVRL